MDRDYWMKQTILKTKIRKKSSEDKAAVINLLASYSKWVLSVIRPEVWIIENWIIMLESD